MEVDDKLVVEQGEAWIEDHFARSRSMTSVEASSRLHRWLLDPLGRLVARLAEAFQSRDREGEAGQAPPRPRQP